LRKKRALKSFLGLNQHSFHGLKGNVFELKIELESHRKYLSNGPKGAAKESLGLDCKYIFSYLKPWKAWILSLSHIYHTKGQLGDRGFVF
jgi:hypothetical protein